MAGPQTYTLRNQTETPQTHAKVSVTVTLPNDDTDSGHLETVDVRFVDSKHHGVTGSGGTVQFAESVRAGYYLLRCRRPGFGPSDGSVTVHEGPAGGVVRVLSESELPSGVVVNSFRVTMAYRDPRIHVHVVQNAAPQGPVPNAHVSVIGLANGDTDANGDWVSDSVSYQRRTVEVWHDSLVPISARNGRFHAVVESRIGGAGTGSLPESRDIHLTVRMAAIAASTPPVATSPVRLWVDGGATPISVDDDPRLSVPGGGDTQSGQDGWDMRLLHGTNSSTSALTQLLQSARRPAHMALAGQPIGEHQITRLALVAHGSDGIMDIQQQCVSSTFGVVPDENQSLTLSRISSYRIDLEALGRFLAADSVVYLCACRLALSQKGEELLKALSLLWPTTKVVGLRTFGSICTASALPRKRPGASGTFPGVRDSRHAGEPSMAGADSNNPPIWANLDILPWFSENSLHATVALDGNIIRRGNSP